MPGLKPGDYCLAFAPYDFPKIAGDPIGTPTSYPAFGAWQPSMYHDFQTISTPNFENAKKSPKQLKSPN